MRAKEILRKILDDKDTNPYNLAKEKLVAETRQKRLHEWGAELRKDAKVGILEVKSSEW